MNVGCPRAWAGENHGAIPNDWIAIAIDRRACSRRAALSKPRSG
jgi:hypothetical protein